VHNLPEIGTKVLQWFKAKVIQNKPVIYLLQL